VGRKQQLLLRGLGTVVFSERWDNAINAFSSPRVRSLQLRVFTQSNKKLIVIVHEEVIN
jgi:hypothetical protein